MNKPAGELSKEDFHRLRVEIKKVRALYILLEHCSRKFEKESYFKLLKNIFKQAGRVREIQIEGALFRKYYNRDVLSKYIRAQTGKLRKKKRAFELMNNKEARREIKNVFNRVIPFIDTINARQLDFYLQKKAEDISKLLKSRSVKTSSLHKLRKELKIYSYNLRSAGVKAQNVALIARKDLQVLMGQWHDCIVIRRHLKKVLNKEELNSAEKLLLKRISKELANGNQELLEQIEYLRRQAVI